MHAMKRYKTIIAWIIIIVILAPFSMFFFHDISYNVAASIIKKNSMAYRENELYLKEFGKSQDPSIIVINNNFSMYSLNDSRACIEYNNYIKNHFNGSVDDIYTVESEILYSYSKRILNYGNEICSFVIDINKNYTSISSNVSRALSDLLNGNVNASIFYIKNITKRIKFTEINISLAIDTIKDLLTNKNIKNENITDLISYIITALELSKFQNNISIKNVTAFINDAVKYGNNKYSARIITENFIVNSTENYSNPLFKVNDRSYKEYIKCLLDNENVSYVVSSKYGIMYNYPFIMYPVIPSNYYMERFTGNNTSLIIINVKNANSKTINEISKDTSRYIKNYYLSGNIVADYQIGNETIHGAEISLFIGIVLAIIISIIFFGSVKAGILPVTVFGISAITASGIDGILYKYVFKSTISFITPTLLLVLILGISSDYTVYFIYRYRENISDDPVLYAKKYAGRAIMISGLTIFISYIVLWLSGIPLFSDDGLANAIGALSTLLVINTFLVPFIKNFHGKIFNKKAKNYRVSKRVSNFAIKHKKAVIAVFIVVTMASGYFYYTTPTGMGIFSLIPDSSAFKAVHDVNDHFQYDVFYPTCVIIKLRSPIIENNGYNLSEYNYIKNVEGKLYNKRYVSAIFGVGYTFGKPVNETQISDYYYKENMDYIGKNSSYVLVKIYMKNLPWSKKSIDYDKSIGKYINGSYYIGGLGEYLENSYTFTESSFYNIIPMLIIVIYIILFILLYSALTPLRLIIIVISSIVSSLSITYYIFKYLMNLPVIIFLPIFVSITLLAVGLDYDIFMVTRVIENIDKKIDQDNAIKAAISDNGSVIMVLGLLLFTTFISLYLSGIAMIEEIGLGISLGVLIDTFVAWFFFVPAIMSLMNRYNWWPSKRT
ncbi:MMPL family transporter [Picrophilus oshimae]|uniref:Transporter involved in lipid transport n=1 Tax=Picrophilus torridus (strain ATCC 700027 / DSM 9790 / JCM 10055 / NBRC 100828 / KAW 2/3) TaxID=1122961 RepID=Q6L1D3_PICTO|nr:MMPL family transporter [Picrophilus oshimae]AAT43219.1 transporter involved in lipid transport [Picrophilus oshimae DSM 9789]